MAKEGRDIAVAPAAEGSSGGNPLKAAVICLDLEAVRGLLAAGADMQARDKHGFTALHFAVNAGDGACVQILLDHGADPEARAMSQQWTPLHLAAATGQAACLQVLLAEGADVHAVDAGQSSALHLAAAKGHLKCAEALLAAGADVAARDSLHTIPLHQAAAGGHVPVIRALVAAGADPAAADKFGWAPSHSAADKMCVDALVALQGGLNALTNGGNHVLHLLAKRASTLQPHQLLAVLSAGADARLAARVRGETPL